MISQAKAQTKNDLAKLPTADTSGFISDFLDSIPDVAKQLGSAEFILNVDPSGIGLNFQFSAKDGTSLAKTWSQLQGSEHALLKKAPMDTVAFGSVAFSPGSKSTKLQKSLLDFSLKMMKTFNKVDPKVAKKVEEGATAFLEQMTGHFLAIVHPYPGSNGLLPSIITGIKDVDRARLAFDKNTKASNEMLTAMQMGVSSGFSQYKIGDAPVTVQKTNYDSASPVMAMFSALMETHTVIANGMSIVAYGADAKPELERAIKGADEGFTKAIDVKRLLSKGVSNAFLYAFISPVKLMQRVSLGGMNPFAATLTGLQAQGGLGFVLGVDGSTLDFLIDVPTALLKDGMAVFTRIKGGM